MTVPSDAPDQRDTAGRDRVVGVLLALGTVAMVGVRLHVLDDEVPNPDISGILYNAERILEGARPYVDTIEIKPPGAFVIVAAVMAVLGRSLEALQLAHAAWLALGGLGVWWATRALHDDDTQPRLGPRCAALSTAVYLVVVSMFSYNYSSWMAPASALAVGAALRGLRTGRLRGSVAAGLWAMVAFVTIQRAVVLAPLLLMLWFVARRRAWPGARPQVFAAWVGGAALPLAALIGWYAMAGHAEALLHGVFPIAVGLDYTATAQGSTWTSILGAIGQLFTVFWFPVGLIVVAGLAGRIEPTRSPSHAGVGAAWLLLSMVGAGLGGGRFYLHYLVQYAPALALLAASPALVRLGARAAAKAGEGRRGARLVIGVTAALALAQLVEIGLGRGQRYAAMARRLEGGFTAAQAAGLHIRQRSPADSTVFAWGWTAWRVYYWAERRSPSRVYKPLGSLTTFNTNTAFESGAGIRFRDGPVAAELVEAFDRHPPRYVVRSPSMVSTFGAKTDPLESFVALRDRIAADYVLEAQYGDLQLFVRRASAP